MASEILTPAVNLIRGVNPLGVTPEQANAISAANAISSEVGQLAVDLLNRRTNLWLEFWRNGSGIQPQDIAAALGTEAASLFARDAALATFLGGVLASLGFSGQEIAAKLPALPAGWTAVPNADGTVTITPPPQ